MSQNLERERVTESLGKNIQELGGKIAITQALQEKGFPIPKTRILPFDDLQNEHLVRAAFAEIRATGPVIVRASHPNDWKGYIDVLPTTLDVTSEEQLQRAIQRIRDVNASEELQIHAKDWGQHFSPEVHVLLQEQSPSPLVGSMMRHPHKLGVVDLNYVDRVEYGKEFGQVYTIAQEDTDRGFFYTDTISNADWGLGERDIHEAMEGYRTVEASGLLDPHWVYQMEIGLAPFMIYQMRPFKHKAPVAPFDVPSTKDLRGTPHISSTLVFGITPEEGIVINCENHQFFPNRIGLANKNEPYGLLLDGRVYNSIPPEVQMGKLELYSTNAGQNAYLVHNEYRPLKRARYGMVNCHTANVKSSIYMGAWDVFKRVRLISNGNRAVIMPE